MKNSDVQHLLDACEADIEKVRAFIDSYGRTHDIVPYLTKYAIIRACGTIELGYKTMVADFCSTGSSSQIRTFIDGKVKDSSRNPSYENMCTLLIEFDVQWNRRFKRQVKIHPSKAMMMSSIESLVDARNDFAHGGNPSTTIDDVINYFRSCRIFIEIIDNILC